MLKSLPIIAASALVAAPAFAGSSDLPEVDVVVTQAAPVSDYSSPDWTGFYGGLELGYANGHISGSGDDDGFIGGLIGGYDYDLGDWVVGAGIDYDFSSANFGNTNTEIDGLLRLKTRGGYKIGNGLLYATTGYANVNTNNAGNEGGYFVGGGYDYLITEQFSVGTEILYHDFGNFNSTNNDAEATTVQLRGAFRF